MHRAELLHIHSLITSEEFDQSCNLPKRTKRGVGFEH